MGRRYNLLRALNIVLLLVGATLVWLRWQEAPPPAPPDRAGTAVASQSPVAAAFEPAATRSPNGSAVGRTLYDRPGTWRDSQGQSLRLAELWGRPAVVTFIYTSCEDACPAVVEHLRAAAQRMPERARRRARFVLLSFDPARDTPARLRAFAREHGVTGPNWLLLTPQDEQVARAAAEALGVLFNSAGDVISHNSVIAAVDDQGRVRARVDSHLEQTVVLTERLLPALLP